MHSTNVSMSIFEKKAIIILAGNLNSGCSYPTTTVLFTSVFQIWAGKAMNVKFNLGVLAISKG